MPEDPSHLFFAAIWLVFTLLFAVLAWKSHSDSRNRFPRFEYRIPGNYNLQIGNVRFQDVINQFAERFDQHIDSMNNTSQSVARWAFWANLISCVLAILGFVTEVCSWS